MTTRQISWLRVFVEGAVIVGSILLAFATTSTASQVQESFPYELDLWLDVGITAGGVALISGAAAVRRGPHGVLLVGTPAVDLGSGKKVWEELEPTPSPSRATRCQKQVNRPSA